MHVKDTAFICLVELGCHDVLLGALEFFKEHKEECWRD